MHPPASSGHSIKGIAIHCGTQVSARWLKLLESLEERVCEIWLLRMISVSFAIDSWYSRKRHGSQFAHFRSGNISTFYASPTLDLSSTQLLSGSTRYISTRPDSRGHDLWRARWGNSSITRMDLLSLMPNGTLGLIVSPSSTDSCKGESPPWVRPPRLEIQNRANDIYSPAATHSLALP